MELIKFCRTVFWLVFLMPVMAQAQVNKPMDLEQYQWKNRLLLLFSPSVDNADIIRQIEISCKNQQGVEERQLVVLELAAGGNSEVMREKMLEQFNVKPDAYTLILLGKDGLEKYRSQKPVPMEEIFRIIDQMPMRRQEMRKQE